MPWEILYLVIFAGLVWLLDRDIDPYPVPLTPNPRHKREIVVVFLLWGHGIGGKRLVDAGDQSLFESHCSPSCLARINLSTLHHVFFPGNTIVHFIENGSLQLGRYGSDLAESVKKHGFFRPYFWNG